MINEKFWLAIAFFTFLALIMKYAWPAIAKALDEKSKQIADDIRAAKEMKELARSLLKKAERNYVESEHYAKKLFKDAEAESEKFAAEAKQILEAEIAKKTAAAMERIRMEEVNAVREIKEKIIANTMKNLSSELSNISSMEHENLMKESVKQLENLK
jgi:F-type H+-transporting ATPase subunit b